MSEPRVESVKIIVEWAGGTSATFETERSDTNQPSIETITTLGRHPFQLSMLNALPEHDFIITTTASNWNVRLRTGDQDPIT